MKKRGFAIVVVASFALGILGFMRGWRESQDAAEIARSRLAEGLKVNENEVEIVSATEKQWPNSCFELERETEFCAQVITPGYEVVMRAKGQEYIYRTNLNGSAVRP